MGEMSASDLSRALTEILLAKGWSFRQTDKTEDEWLPVKYVPSTVHQDLIDNKKCVGNSTAMAGLLTRIIG